MTKIYIYDNILRQNFNALLKGKTLKSATKEENIMKETQEPTVYEFIVKKIYLFWLLPKFEIFFKKGSEDILIGSYFLNIYPIKYLNPTTAKETLTNWVKSGGFLPHKNILGSEMTKILELTQKEIKEGLSWYKYSWRFMIRNPKTSQIGKHEHFKHYTFYLTDDKKDLETDLYE